MSNILQYSWKMEYLDIYYSSENLSLKIIILILKKLVYIDGWMDVVLRADVIFFFCFFLHQESFAPAFAHFNHRPQY